VLVPGGGVEPPRAEARRILSRRGASAKFLKSEPFQSLRKCELREMCSSVRSRRDLSLTVCAQSGKAKGWNFRVPRISRIRIRSACQFHQFSFASFSVCSSEKEFKSTVFTVFFLTGWEVPEIRRAPHCYKMNSPCSTVCPRRVWRALSTVSKRVVTESLTLYAHLHLS
jgi:hypothetical protein